MRHVVTLYYPHIAAARLKGPRGNVEPALLAFYGDLAMLLPTTPATAPC
ncbi:MAG: hypothetical protein WBN80_03415 [Prochlorococcaceae cyanobacterium]